LKKTGPGQAVIVHHDHPRTGNGEADCGCADYRTDADLDTEHRSDDFDYFPTGLYRSEWSEALKFDLDVRAETAEQAKCLAAIKRARAECRANFSTPEQTSAAATPEPEIGQRTTPPAQVDYGEPPFLRCPSWRQPGRGWESAPQGPFNGRSRPQKARDPAPVRASPHAPQRQSSRTKRTSQSNSGPERVLLVAAAVAVTEADQPAGNQPRVKPRSRCPPGP
jgi:hypothetical protein